MGVKVQHDNQQFILYPIYLHSQIIYSDSTTWDISLFGISHMLRLRSKSFLSGVPLSSTLKYQLSHSLLRILTVETNEILNVKYQDRF